jgi:hypothetical protein
MPKEGDVWTITLGKLNGFGGFCPSYFDNAYPFYGNKNQASEIIDVSLVDPNVLAQGPGTADLTGGDENGELGSVLISSILKHVVASGVTYACGQDKVFEITSTAVSNGDWPLSITGGTYQVADSLIYYKSNIYVFWNDTGTEGEIAKIVPGTPSIDVDWGSTTPTGAAHLEDAPHYAINGGDDVVYFTNGQYVGTLEGTTLTVQGLDFWTNSETVSVTWNHNRVKIAVNRPNVAGSNFNLSAVYAWNGVSSAWEGDPIEISGEIGALYTKNGVDFIWWKDGTSTGGYYFGYLGGSRAEPLRRYKGSLPNQNQVGEHDGLITWVTDNKIYKWGARDNDVEVKMFHYMSGEHATIGAMAAPFGDLLVSSYASTEYSLAKASGYSKSARYRTMAFNVSGVDFKSQVDLIQVEFETLSTGAKCDFTLTYDKAASTQSLTQIAYSATDASTRRKILNRSFQVEDFRLDISWANGSVTNPVDIRSIFIKGHYIKDN